MNVQSKIQNPKSKIGRLSLVSLGPGDFQHMTLAAKTALQRADVVIGYKVYIDFVRPLLASEQKIIVSPIGNEIERAKQAIALSTEGRQVALISSGDIGVYAMASPVFELLSQQENTPDVEVYPGVSAIQAAAARLGAPLGHDFCTISLSDLLTPWPVIERRLQAAAWGDFVIGFYNPRSQKRDWQLQYALDVLLAYRPQDTPVAIIRNVTRSDEQTDLTILSKLDPTQVDMFTLVLVGNSQSFVVGQRMITPRGYVEDEQKRKGTETHHDEGKRTFDLLEQENKRETTATLPSDSDVYPITLTRMAGVKAVVIGGGPVGERKTRGLLKAGANVCLVSPEATKQLQHWAKTGQIEWQCRPYQPRDLTGAKFVFAATNQQAVNAQIAQEAKKLSLLCNVADNPVEGDFHVPAVHRQPELVVAVGTTGKSPSRARQIRDKIATWLETTK